MVLTLDDLNTRLDVLEQALPGLIAQNPAPTDFWSAFLKEADAIEDVAGEHVDTVAARLAVMLARHGRYVAFAEAEEA